LARKIARDEREKVDVWVQSLKTRAVTTDQSALNLTNIITNHNTDIPIIETDEKDRPSGEGLNLDTLQLKTDKHYLEKQVAIFKKLHEPIQVEISKDPLIINKYYYGDSQLLDEVSYYPLIQLFIVALFIIITLVTISTRNKSTQNQVWAGMAKETAHQLGTPITSLQGWVELLKDQPGNEKIAIEMSKDVDRLKLVSDRFGKIGSKPQLEPTDIRLRVTEMVQYVKRRATDKVSFSVLPNDTTPLMAPVSGPLFDWVIENLLKNALDAMEGKGAIIVTLQDAPESLTIDVSDTGKGIAPNHINKVFKPGFSTKKRGWGLGLSLSKRIIEQYHKGSLSVKHSELGKGTTFRILIKK
jgi:signal transduction histidine kinase